MKNVLIVSGHRDSENDSVANKQIIEDLKELLPDAEVSILDKLFLSPIKYSILLYKYFYMVFIYFRFFNPFVKRFVF